MAKSRKKNRKLDDLLHHKVCGCIDIREIIDRSAQLSVRDENHCSFSHTVIMMLTTHIYLHELRSSMRMKSEETEAMIEDAFTVSKGIFADCLPYIEERMNKNSYRVALAALSTERMTPQ